MTKRRMRRLAACYYVPKLLVSGKRLRKSRFQTAPGQDQLDDGDYEEQEEPPVVRDRPGATFNARALKATASERATSKCASAAAGGGCSCTALLCGDSP